MAGLLHGLLSAPRRIYGRPLYRIAASCLRSSMALATMSGFTAEMLMVKRVL